MATNRRLQRINRTLVKEISEVIFREVKDPRVSTMVSILDASMANDMKSVRVMVSLYGGKELDQLKTLEALNSAAGFISSIVSKSLRLRFAPHIRFERTHSIEQGVSMYFKLKELSGNDEEIKNS